jgi:hypothetical protein
VPECEAGEEVGEDVEDEVEIVDGDGDEEYREITLELVTPPGASTTHLPSVWVSATRSSLRPHCSRMLRSFWSSIHPCGTSKARAVRVARTVSGVSPVAGDDEGVEEGGASGPEIISSVAPTLQWAGYTGIAYASTNLYVDVDGVDSTSDDGG